MTELRQKDPGQQPQGHRQDSGQKSEEQRSQDGVGQSASRDSGGAGSWVKKASFKAPIPLATTPDKIQTRARMPARAEAPARMLIR